MFTSENILTELNEIKQSIIYYSEELNDALIAPSHHYDAVKISKLRNILKDLREQEDEYEKRS